MEISPLVGTAGGMIGPAQRHWLDQLACVITAAAPGAVIQLQINSPPDAWRSSRTTASQISPGASPSFRHQYHPGLVGRLLLHISCAAPSWQYVFFPARFRLGMCLGFIAATISSHSCCLPFHLDSRDASYKWCGPRESLPACASTFFFGVHRRNLLSRSVRPAVDATFAVTSRDAQLALAYSYCVVIRYSFDFRH